MCLTPFGTADFVVTFIFAYFGKCPSISRGYTAMATNDSWKWLCYRAKSTPAHSTLGVMWAVEFASSSSDRTVTVTVHAAVNAIEFYMHSRSKPAKPVTTNSRLINMYINSSSMTLPDKIEKPRILWCCCKFGDDMRHSNIRTRAVAVQNRHYIGTIRSNTINL